MSKDCDNWKLLERAPYLQSQQSVDSDKKDTLKKLLQLIGKLELQVEITLGNALKEFVTQLLVDPVLTVDFLGFPSLSGMFLTGK